MMQFRLEKRREPSRVMLYATPVAAVVLTMVVGAIIFSLIGYDGIAEAALSEAEVHAEALGERVKAERVRQRSKRITGPLADEFSAARRRIKELREQRRSAIAAVNDDAQAQLSALSAELKAATKRLYAEYCQSGDLYWASFNAVTDNHATAVKRVAAHRRQGRPAALRSGSCRPA